MRQYEHTRALSYWLNKSDLVSCQKIGNSVQIGNGLLAIDLLSNFKCSSTNVASMFH